MTPPPIGQPILYPQPRFNRPLIPRLHQIHPGVEWSRRNSDVPGVGLTEVKNGKIVRDWTYWDQLSLLAQLGITEQPGLFLAPEDF